MKFLEKIKVPILYTSLGLLVGILLSVLFFNTSSGTFQIDLVFWWSIISTILGVILLCISIWQIVIAQSEKEKADAQVKVWMNAANGLSTSLGRIVGDNITGRYTSTNDVCNAVWAVQASAFSLYQSLYEERCVDEKEYQARQKRMMDKLEEEQLTNKPPASPTT